MTSAALPLLAEDLQRGTSAAGEDVPPLSSAATGGVGAKRQRKPRRTRQQRANRSARRAGWTFLIPFLGVPFIAFYYLAENDLERTAIAVAATVAVALALGPLILWWSVSGLRRGAQHLFLGLFTGVVGGFLTAVLIASLVGGGFAWSLLTGEPVPFAGEGFDLTKWLFLSPVNPLDPWQYMSPAND